MQTADSLVALQNVPYGHSGSFAVNLWFKVTSVEGSHYAYLFSHSASTPEVTDFDPNQVGRP